MLKTCFRVGSGPVTDFILAFPNFNFRSCLPIINRQKMVLAVGFLMVLAGAIRAQTLADLGATAPIPGAQDIAQLSSTGNQTDPDGLNYFTDNQTGYGTGEPGQTFTTWTNTAGYTLTSVSFMTAGLRANYDIGTPQPYSLHIYSVSGGNATLLKLIPRPISPSTTATGCNGAVCPYKWRPIPLMPGRSATRVRPPARKQWASPAAIRMREARLG